MKRERKEKERKGKEKEGAGEEFPIRGIRGAQAREERRRRGVGEEGKGKDVAISHLTTLCVVCFGLFIHFSAVSSLHHNRTYTPYI